MTEECLLVKRLKKKITQSFFQKHLRSNIRLIAKWEDIISELDQVNGKNMIPFARDNDNIYFLSDALSGSEVQIIIWVQALLIKSTEPRHVIESLDFPEWTLYQEEKN